MNDRTALLKSVRENPDDDTLRLVYADCVEEGGDELVAGIVRLHVEFARLPRWNGKVYGVAWGAAEREKCSLWHSARSRLHARYKKLAARSIAGLRDTILCTVKKSDGPSDFRVTLKDFEEEDDTSEETRRFEIASYVFSRGLCSHLFCRWEYWCGLGDKILLSHPVSEVTLSTAAELSGLFYAGTNEDSIARLEVAGKSVKIAGGLVSEKDVLGARWPGVKFNTHNPSRLVSQWRGRIVLSGLTPPSVQPWFMSGVANADDFGLQAQENL